MTARMIEHREGVSFRVAGRTLSGRALVYGDTADMGDFLERFEPGAHGEVRTIPINLQHDPRLIVTDSALLTDSARSLDVRADLPEGSAALALVDRGAYPGATAEIRARARSGGKTAELKAGRVLRSRIPYDTPLACECLKRGGGAACIPLARFSKIAGDEMASAINDALAEARDVLAVMGEYKRPIASASRGTLRAVSTKDGLDIEMELPSGDVGDAVVSAHESAGIVVRPLIDFDRSGFTDGPDGREYTKPWLRAFLVGATDTKEGWPDPVISTPSRPKTTAETIAALSKIGQRRNRLWF